ncbi:MAG: endolytic transglycosylase MltG [Dechloromonas sp.]|nr:endolytic transglycosylase MltG [Dechloromonas sp.]
MRFVFRIFLLSSALLGITIALFFGWATHALSMPGASEFRILPGSTVRQAALQIRQSGIALEPQLFTLLARLKGQASAIRAGSYAVEPSTTPIELLRMLVDGRVVQAEITFPEGWTFRQIRARLDAHPDLTHDTRDWSEARLLAALGLDVPSLEGQLFPDTYHVDKQSTDLELLRRAQRAMASRLASAWAERAAALPYRTPQEALIMASIVEKETGQAADRNLVAAVFVNRLRRGMLLQTDPTVIYGLGSQFDGNLRKRDLQTDTPYNTYTRPGLPPTPIAMPGAAALQAALNPAHSDALYFVARGDGSSQFSRTLNEHNHAVNTYQRGKK